MKLRLSVFIAALGIFSTVTVASTSQSAVANGIAQKIATTPPTPGSVRAGELKPIRYAKVRVSIMQTSITKVPSGYEWSTRIVCNTVYDAPVFDLRGVGDHWYAYGNGPACKTVINSKNRQIRMNAALAISTDPVFGPGTPAIDRKTFSANVYLLSENPTDVIPSRDYIKQGAWSRDLNLKTLGLTLEQQVDQVCNSHGVCQTEPQEFITASVEFED